MYVECFYLICADLQTIASSFKNFFKNLRARAENENRSSERG